MWIGRFAIVFEGQARDMPSTCQAHAGINSGINSNVCRLSGAWRIMRLVGVKSRCHNRHSRVVHLCFAISLLTAFFACVSQTSGVLVRYSQCEHKQLAFACVFSTVCWSPSCCVRCMVMMMMRQTERVRPRARRCERTKHTQAPAHVVVVVVVLARERIKCAAFGPASPSTP